MDLTDVNKFESFVERFIIDTQQTIANLRSEITEKSQYLNFLKEQFRTIEEYTTFRITFKFHVSNGDELVQSNNCVFVQKNKEGAYYLTAKFEEIEKLFSGFKHLLSSSEPIDFDETIPVLEVPSSHGGGGSVDDKIHLGVIQDNNYLKWNPSARKAIMQYVNETYTGDFSAFKFIMNPKNNVNPHALSQVLSALVPHYHEVVLNDTSLYLEKRGVPNREIATQLGLQKLESTVL